jgi:putative ATP-binding cassette transporter
MHRVLDTLTIFYRLAAPYFRSEDRWHARLLLAAVIVSEFGVVYAVVVFNIWNAYFFNSIEARNWDDFIYSLFLFCGIAVWTVVAYMAQFYFGQMLILRWRRWMTRRFVGQWMENGRHYRMRFRHSDVDNVHLRIANDILIFIQKTHDLGYNFLGSLIALFSFAYILWGLSSAAPLILFGSNFAFPGYLFWVAILYACVGTLLAHLVGNPLIRLNFNQQHYESDFRFGIARVWDHTEPVALMRGEEIERKVLDQRFTTLIQNWLRLILRQTGLSAFINSYGQASVVFPILVASPAYFTGAISLGLLMQASLAFQKVETSFAFFLHSYPRIAEWKASMDRVAQLEAALNAVDHEAIPAAQIVVDSGRSQNLEVSDLVVRLPSRAEIASVPKLALNAGEGALISGPSGSGKSTVLRALAGIWPIGEGRIELPAGADVMALPQRVYFPLAPLRAAITYPTPPERVSETELREIIEAVGLPHLLARLDEEAEWNVVLSGGEQQRVALARALFRRPDVLLLDDAVSNFDEVTARKLYELVFERLPETIVISVGKPAQIGKLHHRSINLERVPHAAPLMEDSIAAAPA